MPRRIPKLCKHKRSGRAYATDPFTHKEEYFGLWGTQQAQQAYENWVRKLLDRRADVPSGAPPGTTVLVADLIADFLEYARSYYLKNGRPTSEVPCLKDAAEIVLTVCGTDPASSFGPSKLKSVRSEMVRKGWARGYVNKQIGRVRRIWKWGVANELIPPDVLVALQAVQGLSRGRTEAREEQPVQPVDLATIRSTLPHLPSLTLRLMTRVHLYAAMRAIEVVAMRPCDLDRSTLPWLYRVPEAANKTAHHGKERLVWLGPRARAILTVLLRTPGPEDRWIFPTPSKGGSRGCGRYTVAAYRRAITRAVGRCNEHRQRLGLPPIDAWTPLQLRHTGGTKIREIFGAEGAQVILGHEELKTTEIYAEKSSELARRIAEQLG